MTGVSPRLFLALRIAVDNIFWSKFCGLLASNHSSHRMDRRSCGQEVRGGSEDESLREVLEQIVESLAEQSWLQNDVSQLKERIETLRSEGDRRRRYAEKVRAEIAAVKAEQDELKRQIAAHKAKKEAVDREIANLEAELQKETKHDESKDEPKDGE
ncbi:hypothetical protein M3Y94_00951100 [Aphelenchoides besseyi]|nr:hypothetical protein M3Y94_00951100 [Aphelenchoides besseyi]